MPAATRHTRLWSRKSTFQFLCFLFGASIHVSCFALFAALNSNAIRSSTSKMKMKIEKRKLSFVQVFRCKSLLCLIAQRFASHFKIQQTPRSVLWSLFRSQNIKVLKREYSEIYLVCCATSGGLSPSISESFTSWWSHWSVFTSHLT